MKTIGIIGGSGFVGTHLAAMLVKDGCQVIIFGRNPPQHTDNQSIRYAQFDYANKKCDIAALQKLDAVVNLSGAGVADKRWTTARKAEILTSREDHTLFLVAQLKAHAPQCTTFIAASATGYYGPDQPGATPFTETASPYPDFLGETCKKWEAASEKGADFMRTVIMRTGIVLGKEGGAFREFVKPMAFGIAPVLGSGDQIVSWIAVTDLALFIIYAIENKNVNGTYNLVAPHPVTHRQLIKTIAKEKGGIKIAVPVPGFMLKLVLGELSIEVLKSCNVSAEKTLKTGFVFRYPTIQTAVAHVLAVS